MRIWHISRLYSGSLVHVEFGQRGCLTPYKYVPGYFFFKKKNNHLPTDTESPRTDVDLLYYVFSGHYLFSRHIYTHLCIAHHVSPVREGFTMHALPIYDKVYQRSRINKIH